MITKYPKLKNPPIAEVIVGIAFEKNSELTLKEVNELKNEIQKTWFKEEKKTYEHKLKINFSEAIARLSNKNAKQKGYLLKQNNLVLFLEKNRITLKQIGQYKNYEKFIKNYKALLDILIEKKKTIKIYDIALRYINKFNLKNEKLKEYKIQPLLGKSDNIYLLSDFNSTYKLTSAKYGLNAIINSSITVKSKDKISITFDIDAHKNEIIIIQKKQDIISILENIRSLIKSIFFENLPNAGKMEEFK